MRVRILLLFLVIVQLGCDSKRVNFDSKFELDFESKENLDNVSKSNDGKIASEMSYNGNSSLLLPEKNDQLVLSFLLKPNKIYKVSYWRKGLIALRVFLQTDEKLKLKEPFSYKSDKGWDKVELLINTAWIDSPTNSKVFIKNEIDTTGYVDDFVFEEVEGGEPDFNFEIKKKQVHKIVDYRNGAVHSPFIRPKFKKKVKAELNGEPVQFKLKGDWTDHVSSGIWSFKTYGKTPITKDLKTLTFQNAKTRNLLNEWMFIRLCNSAGIVTPTYEFVNVSVNHSTPYVCALEEDFSNDFINRKRGYSTPVLRLYEDFLFPHWAYGWGHKKIKIPEINHSYIYCYDEEKYSSGENRKKFDEDALKLKEFIKGDSIIHLVDIDKWAEFLAIQALTKSFHNLTWHNTRWFVNDKGLIEPIAYDGNTQDKGAERWFGGLYGDLNRYLNEGASMAVNFNNKLFMNQRFMKAYKAQLELYSDASFLKNKIESFEPELKIALLKLQQYYDYDYSKESIFNSAKKLKNSIAKIDNSNWIGRERIFNVDFKTGNAPLNEIYASNLIRGYQSKKVISLVNGTAHQIKIFTNSRKKKHTIEGNGQISMEYIEGEKWYVKVDGEKIEIPIVSWVPLI